MGNGSFFFVFFGFFHCFSKFLQLDQFLIGDLHAVLSLDATFGSHPIIQTVTTPDQITEVFDTISYNKVTV